MKNHRFPPLLLALLFFHWGNTQDSYPAPHSFFRTVAQLREEIPLMHLRTNWRQLVRNKQKEEYQPGAMHWVDEAGDTLWLTVRLRARGNMRKQVCNYPPLQIKFKKTATLRGRPRLFFQ